MRKKSLTFSFRYLLLFFSVLGFASCVAEKDQITKEPKGSDAMVYLKVRTSQGSLPRPETKAQTLDEKIIQNIHVLVFDHADKFKYMNEGVITSSTADATTFEVSLKTSAQQVKLILVANAASTLSTVSLAPGESLAAIQGKLNVPIDHTGLSTPLPMIGQVVVSHISATVPNDIPDVTMLRSIARADVVIQASNFQLVDARVFRENSKIQLISPNITGPVTQPYVPSSSLTNVNTDPVVAVDNKIEGALYLSESNKEPQLTAATVVVVGGKYNGGPVTYYRVDFDLNTAAHPLGQVLRNHHYIFTVTRVHGPGKDTPEEAANDASKNISVTVQEWNTNTTYMEFDNQDYFGVSTRYVKLPSGAGKTSLIHVSTSLDSYTIQWAMPDGSPDPGSTPSNSLNNGVFQVDIEGNDIKITTLRKSWNGEFWSFLIRARHWLVKIDIEQASSFENHQHSVNILSLGTYIGSLGGTIPLSQAGDAAGLKGILSNPNNFGPGGVVTLENVNFFLQSSYSTYTKQLLDVMDILVFGYRMIPLTVDQSLAVIQWLNASPHRFLIVYADDAQTNQNIILLGGSTSWVFFGGIAPVLQFNPWIDSDNEYFLSTGPFGPVVGEYSSYRAVDGTWGRATIYDGVTPLVLANETEMFIGIDKTNRVLYLGDANSVQSRALRGVFVPQNTTGELDSDVSILYANIMAYIIEEVVLPGKSTQQ